MSEEELKSMCNAIYEGEDWEPMIDLVKNKDKEIERLKGVYKKNLELVDKMYVKDKEIERLNNIINEALGIANERVNHYSHINKKEILEDWKDIFDALAKRDNQKLKGSDKE